MIKRTLLFATVVVLSFSLKAAPTNTPAATTPTQVATPQQLSFADVVLNQANETCGANNVQEFLTAARNTKDYVAKHPYFAGSIVAIAAGPKRIGRAITFPIRFIAKTATTAIVVAATTLAVIHQEEITSWTKKQVTSAKATLKTMQERAAQATTRFTTSELTPAGLSDQD